MNPFGAENREQIKADGRREQAEMLGIKALGYIAADDEKLGSFLAQAGLAPEDLRHAAKSRNFLNFVFDFICSEDEIILEFARFSQIKPEAVMAARQILAGKRNLESHE